MKLFFYLTSTFFLLCSAPVLADNDARHSLIRILNSYRTYKAAFKQWTGYGEMKEAQLSRGTVYLKRPNQFRWDVGQPFRQIIIVNRLVSWIYDIDLRQVTQKQQKLSEYNLIGLLGGNTAQVLNSYKVNRVKLNKKLCYELKPRSLRSHFLWVRLCFLRHRLLAIWMENTLKQKIMFQFSKIQINVPISDKLFNFKPPEGVDILK